MASEFANRRGTPALSRHSPSVSRLSFGPVSKTTVVTTTTTTTTTLPPLVISAPRRHKVSLDARQFPLYDAPMPECIKRLALEVNGKPAFLRVVNPDDQVDMIDDIARVLEDCDGTKDSIKYEQNPPPRKQSHKMTSSTYRKRPASPVSLAEEDANSSFSKPTRKPKRKQWQVDSHSHRRTLLTDMDNLTPVTELDDPSTQIEPSLSGDSVMYDAPMSPNSTSGSPPRISEDWEHPETLNLMRLPDLIATFDNVSPRVQPLVMYHLLRRCDKRTLQFIASLVNPSLKRDFITMLPYELAVHILKFLDSKSLCRAAQVSKGWQNIVDTDESVWKERCLQDGFTLPEGHIQRAISENWVGEDFDNTDKRPKKQLRSSKRRRKTEDLKMATGSSLNTPLPLRLFKAIYRRQDILKRSWMDPDRQPHHITFNGHGRNIVTCLHFDDEKILSGSDDHSINVFSTRDGTLLRRMRGHENGVWALEYCGNTLVSGSTDRTVRIWDIETGECTHVFGGHTSTVRCLQIMDGDKLGTKVVVTGSRDSSLRVWRLPKPKDPRYDFERDDGPNPFFLRKLTGHTQSVRAIAGQDDLLVSGSYDNSVKLWRVSTGQCVHTYVGHAARVYSVAIDTTKGKAVSGSMDCFVKVWDLMSGECLYTLEGHSSLVGLLSLSCNQLVSAAADSTLRIWNLDSGQCQHVLTAHTGAITCFQHDDQKVISGSDGNVKMWDIRTGRFIRDILTGLSGVWQIKFDERRCVAAVQRNQETCFEVLDFGTELD